MATFGLGLALALGLGGCQYNYLAPMASAPIVDTTGQIEVSIQSPGSYSGQVNSAAWELDAIGGSANVQVNPDYLISGRFQRNLYTQTGRADRAYVGEALISNASGQLVSMSGVRHQGLSFGLGVGRRFALSQLGRLWLQGGIDLDQLSRRQDYADDFFAGQPSRITHQNLYAKPWAMASVVLPLMDSHKGLNLSFIGSLRFGLLARVQHGRTSERLDGYTIATNEPAMRAPDNLFQNHLSLGARVSFWRVFGSLAWQLGTRGADDSYFYSPRSTMWVQGGILLGPLRRHQQFGR